MNIIIKKGDEEYNIPLKKITKQILIEDIVPRIKNGTPGLQDKSISLVIGNLIEELLKSIYDKKWSYNI